MNLILKLEAISIVVGTIIGAGILGIPYVFAQNNFFTAFLFLLVIGVAMLTLLLLMGEISLRTKTNHQLTGYADIYLGKLAKHFLGVVMVLSIYGSLLAYTIGQGQVLSAIFNGSEFVWSIIFYLVFAFLVILGLKTVKTWEFFLTIGIFVIVAVISWLSAPQIHLPNINGLSFENLFVVYGVVLFACSGVAAVGEVRELLFGKGREKFMKKALVWGMIIPIIIYIVFSFLVVGVSGENTTAVATIGLGEAIGPKMILFGNLFAFVAMGSSFLALGIALREIFTFDYKIKPLKSSLFVVAIPIFGFLFGLRDFIEVISFVGAIGTGLAGIFMVFTYWSARKNGQRQPEYKLSKIFALPASIILLILFVGGILYAFSFS